jgi:hypothetical protein
MSEFVVDIDVNNGIVEGNGIANEDNPASNNIADVANSDRQAIRKKLVSEFKERGLSKVYIDYAEEPHVQYSGGRYTRIRNAKRQLQHNEMAAPKELS